MSIFLFVLFSIIFGACCINLEELCDDIDCNMIRSQDLDTFLHLNMPNIEIDSIGEVGDGPIQVRFILYNRENMYDPDLFILNTTENVYKNFDRNKPLKILVHGWIGSVDCEFVQTVLKAYLPKLDYNIIVVDWAQESHRLYPLAKSSVPKIGEMLAEFIGLLYSQYNIKPESIHILGHSLGAHISGIAGRLLHFGQIGRITGLDPALPLYSEKDEDRLHQDSANFVDVIHTCGRYLGWFNTIGHVDFYPNRGIPIQPGCGIDVLGICSHGRSYVYYSETITETATFMALPCDTWDHYKRKECANTYVLMGENLSSITRGTYYLTTNDKAPFGRGIAELIHRI